MAEPSTPTTDAPKPPPKAPDPGGMRGSRLIGLIVLLTVVLGVGTFYVHSHRGLEHARGLLEQRGVDLEVVAARARERARVELEVEGRLRALLEAGTPWDNAAQALRAEQAAALAALAGTDGAPYRFEVKPDDPWAVHATARVTGQPLRLEPQPAFGPVTPAREARVRLVLALLDEMKAAALDWQLAISALGLALRDGERQGAAAPEEPAWALYGKSPWIVEVTDKRDQPIDKVAVLDPAERAARLAERAEVRAELRALRARGLAWPEAARAMEPLLTALHGRDGVRHRYQVSLERPWEAAAYCVADGERARIRLYGEASS